MKKLVGVSAIVFLFSMCSTEIELLDDWKETCVVYGLLDQSQPIQYVRIQKAFLGPDNAYNMAQQYDSINYVNSLDVKIEQWLNGNLFNVFTLSPDTFYNKQPGDFFSPMQVIYSFDDTQGPLYDNCEYRLVINNNQTGNLVTASTNLVEDFNITAPIGPTISFIKVNQNTRVEVKWSGAPSARLYQLAMYFYYFETDINNVTTGHSTPAWIIGEVETTANTANATQSIKFDPDGFYRFVAQHVPQDDNVVKRESVSVEFKVFACEGQLNEYMEINGPSSGLAQERPIYTNINNGLGVFSARTVAVKSNLVLTNQTLDSLSYGGFTCPLKFEDRNGVVMGCQ